MKHLLLVFLSVLIFSPVPSTAIDNPSTIVVFVPQAKLRVEPSFTAEIAAKVPEGTQLSATGKRKAARAGEDHFGIIDESWAEVEHEGKLLWVPRRDCLPSELYQKISVAQKAGIAGDDKAMIEALWEEGTLVFSPDKSCVFVMFDPDLFGVFMEGRGLVERFELDSPPDVRWSSDNRYVVIGEPNGPRNVYDMQKEKAYNAGGYDHLNPNLRDWFISGYYLYIQPGDEVKIANDDSGFIRYQPQIWALNLENGENFMLLEGKKETAQRHCGAWVMEMKVYVKDVPDAIKASEFWEENSTMMGLYSRRDQGD